MLIISNNASCDICLENYHSALLPYSLPCGHVLCASCCVGIIDSTETSTLCPFCRNPYTRDGVRVIRIESDTPHGDASGQGPSRLENQSSPSQMDWSSNPGIHSNRTLHQAKCDFCTNAILGERYKCAQCPDFDSCKSCFPHVPIRHPGHIFIRIRSAEDYLYERNRQPRPTHHANCDNCRQMICGVRYKCSHPSCIDFDLCENCEAQPVPVHPTSHVFYKIRGSEQPPVPTPPLPHPAACNACQSGIFGIRYKCMNCYDFDLCERCEAANLPSIHPPSHLLVKIRDPRIALR